MWHSLGVPWQIARCQLCPHGCARPHWLTSLVDLTGCALWFHTVWLIQGFPWSSTGFPLQIHAKALLHCLRLVFSSLGAYCLSVGSQAVEATISIVEQMRQTSEVLGARMSSLAEFFLLVLVISVWTLTRNWPESMWEEHVEHALSPAPAMQHGLSHACIHSHVPWLILTLLFMQA